MLREEAAGAGHTGRRRYFPGFTRRSWPATIRRDAKSGSAAARQFHQPQQPFGRREQACNGPPRARHAMMTARRISLMIRAKFQRVAVTESARQMKMILKQYATDRPRRAGRSRDYDIGF